MTSESGRYDLLIDLLADMLIEDINNEEANAQILRARLRGLTRHQLHDLTIAVLGRLEESLRESGVCDKETSAALSRIYQIVLAAETRL